MNKFFSHFIKSSFKPKHFFYNLRNLKFGIDFSSSLNSSSKLLSSFSTEVKSIKYNISKFSLSLNFLRKELYENIIISECNIMFKRFPYKILIPKSVKKFVNVIDIPEKKYST